MSAYGRKPKLQFTPFFIAICSHQWEKLTIQSIRTSSTLNLYAIFIGFKAALASEQYLPSELTATLL
jgi:hypothetical protein